LKGSCLELKVQNSSILKTGHLARYRMLISWLALAFATRHSPRAAHSRWKRVRSVALSGLSAFGSFRGNFCRCHGLFRDWLLLSDELS